MAFLLIIVLLVIRTRSIVGSAGSFPCALLNQAEGISPFDPAAMAIPLNSTGPNLSTWEEGHVLGVTERTSLPKPRSMCYSSWWFPAVAKGVSVQCSIAGIEWRWYGAFRREKDTEQVSDRFF